MVASGARGAYICARCQLSHGLSQTTSRVPWRNLFWPTGRAQHRAYTDDEAQHERIARRSDQAGEIGTKGIYFKSLSTNGRIIGRRGRRQRAKAEPLKIKSLDQDSEVIVLRDYVEDPLPEAHRRPPDDIELSNLDIDADDDQIPDDKTALSKEDLFKAIEEFRPTEEITDQETYHSKKQALADAFTTAQLRAYFRRHGLHIRASKSTVAKIPKPEVQPWKHLPTTPWLRRSKDHSGPLANTLSGRILRKPGATNKAVYIESIFRHVWNAGVVGQVEVRGDTDLLLSPVQWKLLQNRNASTLFSTLRNTRLFTATKLTRVRGSDALRLTGPKDETTAMTDLFKSAFMGTSSIHLDTCLTTNNPSLSLDNSGRYTTGDSVVEKIMHATNTVIIMDQLKQTTDIIGFDDTATEHALRMLASISQAETPVVYTVCELGRSETQLVPISIRGSLSLEAQDLSWRRLQSTDQEVVQHEERQHQRDVISKNMPSQLNDSTIKQHSIVTGDQSLWIDHQPYSSPLRASFGYLLHRHEDDPVDAVIAETDAVIDAPVNKSKRKSKKNISRMQKEPDMAILANRSYAQEAVVPVFAAHVPSCINVLSHFIRLDHVLAPNKASTSGNTKRLPSANVYLRARLIPLERPSDSKVLPLIELLFSSRRTYIDARTQKYFGVPPSSTKLELLSVHAILERRVHDIALPALAVDVRLERDWHVAGNMPRLMEQPQFKNFVDSIMESFEGETLRALPFLDIQPPATLDLDGNSKAQTKNTARYVFAGFELSDVRRLRPATVPQDMNADSDSWQVVDVDGGFAGGKRTIFSVEADAEESDPESFVQRCFAAANFINDVHRGVIPAISSSDTNAKEEKVD